MRRGAAQALAQVVAERMGGRFAYDELEARYAAAAAQRKAAAGGLVTRIGDLQVGLARHRALLFKALADACELPCRLLRGPMHLGAPPPAPTRPSRRSVSCWRLPVCVTGLGCSAGVVGARAAASAAVRRQPGPCRDQRPCWRRRAAPAAARTPYTHISARDGQQCAVSLSSAGVW